MDLESEERLFATLGKLKGSATILIVTHDTGFVSALTYRVLCMGSREDGAEYAIVQHRVENSEAPGALRIVHDESIPGDRCVGEEA